MAQSLTKNNPVSGLKVAPEKEADVSRAFNAQRMSALRQSQLPSAGSSPGLRADSLPNKAQEMMLAGNRVFNTHKSDGEGKKEPLAQRLSSFRQSINAAKKAQGDKRMSLSSASGAGASNPAKRGTAWLLKASWLNIIDSFGLTFIYINIHAFALMIPFLKPLFCELGEEWVPKGASLESVRSKMKRLAFLEKMLIFSIDALLLSLFLAECAVLTILVQFFFNSWFENILEIFKNWEVFKELVKLAG